MAEDPKKYIDEEIRKSDLRLVAESERIQRVIAESRLNFYIKLVSVLGAVVGISLPLLLSWMLSSRNSTEFDRMGRKIEDLNVQVQEKLGQEGKVLEKRLDSIIVSTNSEVRRTLNDFSKIQSKPPKFSAIVGGKPLDGFSLDLTPSLYSATIALTNIGEGTARSIGLTLYCADSTYFDNMQFNYSSGNWSRLQFVDERAFKAQYKLQYSQSIVLSPQETFPVEITISPESSPISTNAMLKVTYEQGSPKKFFFKITFKK